MTECSQIKFKEGSKQTKRKQRETKSNKQTKELCEQI